MIESPADPKLDKGLANTVVAESHMSYIDGENGVLEYVGIDIDSLARNSTFEETTYLLWNRRLPTADELATFSASIRAEYDLPDLLWTVIEGLPKSATPMHALRTLASCLALTDPEADDSSEAANERKAIRLLAKIPALIANFDRHRKGKESLRPDKSQSVAESFLTMLNGERPTDAMARAFDICLILHAEHGFNASTFASMVTISTLSDMYSAITTAIGTLKGPLHGGANEGVMKMLNEIGDVDKVDAWVEQRMANKDKIMGFGHRVYKTVDPRATYLKTFAKQIAEDTGNMKLYEMSHRIEEIMHEKVASRGIYPNVDFYSATMYHCLGLDLDLFTPIFAMARTSGWAAHCIEYLEDNKLMRPRCDYIGPHGVAYVAIADR